MALPCPKCGKPATCGIFCKECIKIVHPLVLGTKPAKIVFCALCDRVKPHSDWKNMDLEHAISKSLAPVMIFAPDAHIESVEFSTPEFERKPGIKKNVTVLAVVTGHHEDAKNDYEEECEVRLDYEVTLCTTCSRKGSAYFEGILQVRNLTPVLRSDIYSYIQRHQHKGLRLAKEVPVGNTGADYYLSDQRMISQIGKHLHSKYGGELRLAAQHFSYDHNASRNLYRVNAYLEVPEFAKGDVIRVEGKYFLVIGISGTIKGENLLTGEEENIVYRKGEPVRLTVDQTKIVNLDPLQVLHPKNYEVVTARLSKRADSELALDSEVTIAYDSHELFIIPATRAKEAVKKKKVRHSQKRRTRDEDLSIQIRC